MLILPSQSRIKLTTRACGPRSSFYPLVSRQYYYIPTIFRNIFVRMLLVIVMLMWSGCNNNFCNGQRWFQFKQLINPGLTAPTFVSSQQDCVGQCVANSKCSAVSYQQGTQHCVFSYCAHLHMVTSTGWNTYVLSKLLSKSF